MQQEFSYPLKIDELGQGEQKYALKANKAQLQTLREILQVPEVKSFGADMKLIFQKKKGILEITGKVKAKLSLISVISLELFDKEYETDFKVVYDTNAKYEDIYQDDEDINLDLPDIVVGGQIDLGDIAIEQLALILEDHPRQAGETFESVIEDNSPVRHNPFAVLEKLKK